MDNKYKRPNKTFQDTLGSKEIKELLKDYKQIYDITTVPINSHIRYFIYKDGEQKFRLGGNITKIDPIKGYIILSNGKTSWSVQIKNTIFFKKYDIDELRKEYEKKINKYKNKNKKLEESLQEIKKKLSKNKAK